MSAATQTQWCEFWHRLGAMGDPLPPGQELHTAYSQDWRAYHNLEHIGDCLGEFEAVRAPAANPLAVETAIWFHDAIYDTRRKDNEERSADFAHAILTRAGLPPGFLESVRALILATKHIASPADPDAALLTDIDLSILGQPPARFTEFEEQIREEYIWVADADFAAGRADVLKGFLERRFIYATEVFRAKYESQARENLRWAIRHLTG